MAIGFAACSAKPTALQPPPGISFICDNLTLNDRNHTCRSFMCPEESSPAIPRRAARPVSLSPYVNERFPNWEELLTARDVARLTRRPRWMLTSMVLLRRFPRKRQYHGRGIGWLRSDVIHWLGKDLRAAHCLREPALPRPAFVARQTSLPLECTGPCALHRNRRRRCALPTRGHHE